MTMNVTEKTTLDSIKNAFERENIQTHWRVLGYEIDIYFHDYKLAVETRAAVTGGPGGAWPDHFFTQQK